MRPPRPRLSERVLAAAAPGARDRILWDGEVTGFGVKVTPRGTRVFILQHRAHGSVERLTIGRFGAPWTVETARARARDLLAELAGGGDPQARRRAGGRELTVRELGGLYLAGAMKGRSASWRASVRRAFANHIDPFMGERPAREVTPAEVDRLVAAVARGDRAPAPGREEGPRRGGAAAQVRGGPQAASRAAQALSAAYRYAAGLRLVSTDPAAGAKRFRRRRVERVLAPDELRRLFQVLAAAEALAAANRAAIAVIRLIVLTGGRAQELLAAKACDLDRGARVLSLGDARRGRRRVPLGPAALAVLDGLPARGARARLIPGARDGRARLRTLERVWSRLRRAAGLAEVRLEDLRRAYLTVAAAGGENLAVVGRITGDGAWGLERFQHLADRPAQEAAERISAELAALLGPGLLAAAAGPPGMGEGPSADWLGHVVAERWLTAREAAGRAGLEVGTLAAYRAAGLGPPYRKLPGHVLYPQAPLEAWILAREGQPRRGRPPKAAQAKTGTRERARKTGLAAPPASR